MSESERGISPHGIASLSRHGRLASACDLGYGFPAMISENTNPDLTPAPSELVAKAEAAVREFEVQCFWFWRPDAVVRTVEDIQVVIKELRRNGDRRAWRAAQELQRCL